MDGYDFLECERCAFIFAPVLGRDHTRALYAERMPEAPRSGWANESFLRPALRRLGSTGRTILDFGAGDSKLPDRLRARGYRVVAVDAAPPARPHPDRLTGDLLDLELPSDHFDLVYAFQVFEHLPEPRPYLEELLRLARRGGLITVHTDMHVPERRHGLERWWYVMPPVHCSFYCHRTFEVAVEAAGHRVLRKAPKWILIQKGDGHGPGGA